MARAKRVKTEINEHPPKDAITEEQAEMDLARDSKVRKSNAEDVLFNQKLGGRTTPDYVSESRDEAEGVSKQTAKAMNQLAGSKKASEKEKDEEHGRA